MTNSEFFSWCACLSIGALATLAAGIPGLLCLICGMVVSQIDVGWIEDRTAQRRTALPPDPGEPIAETGWKRIKVDLQPKKQRKTYRRKAAEVLPDNVIQINTAVRASSRNSASSPQ